MIARLTQWQPREGIGVRAALAAWERHAGPVARVPGLRRYVQNHAVPAPDGTEPPCAGVGEAWFDDATAARAALQSPEWAAVIEDAQSFVDLETVVAAWVEPRLVRDF